MVGVVPPGLGSCYLGLPRTYVRGYCMPPQRGWGGVGRAAYFPDAAAPQTLLHREVHTLDKKSKSLRLRRGGMCRDASTLPVRSLRDLTAPLSMTVAHNGVRNFVICAVPLGLSFPFIGLTPDLRPGYCVPPSSAPLRAGSTGLGWGGAGCVFSSRCAATKLYSSAESTGGASELHRSFVGQRTPSSG